MLFVKLHTEAFKNAKFDNDLDVFYVDNPDQQFFLFWNPLGCIQFYSSLHFTWASSWLDWKTLFVKQHTDTYMSAKFDNEMSTLFVDNPDKKLIYFRFYHDEYTPTLAFIPFEQVID